ncbi:MAG TPA: 4'-phosphopantetheinyl transferase superfamily protein [Pedococcus sp.]
MAVEVDVRWRRVEDDPARLDELARLLDERERERAGRRRRPAAFVTAHALLRSCAAEALGVDPAEVAFERTCATCGSHRHGKPAVVGSDLSVSLSYAGRLAVVARSWGGEVGVDVEEVEESDFDGFDAVTLDASEVAALAGLEGAGLRLARARVWARKESVLKATGHGLVVDPRQVVVSGPAEPAALRDWLGEHPRTGPVQLADVDLDDPQHVVAVALLADDAPALTVVSA